MGKGNESKNSNIKINQLHINLFSVKPSLVWVLVVFKIKKFSMNLANILQCQQCLSFLLLNISEINKLSVFLFSGTILERLGHCFHSGHNLEVQIKGLYTPLRVKNINSL